MKKSRYIDLMEKVLSAYSNEHIIHYYNTVKSEGLKEHGYPRLTANIGILIAHGRRTDLTPQFIKMMDLCCEEIPKYSNCANEFSIKEVIFAIMELEKNQTLGQTHLDRWKNLLKTVTVEKCYRVYATAPDSEVYNWAAFAMLSEWMRYQIGLAPADMEFIENQAASQLQWVDENGMYCDPNAPVIYDLVTRGLFSLLLHFGYRGKYAGRWDDILKRAGILTLKMFSAIGELPYGGRSNQFLNNEAHCCVIFECEAGRYAKADDMENAFKFKSAVKKALDHLSEWLDQQPINHVKNRFPRSTGYGCEKYAYFDKYMITTASFLYAAYLLSDDSIPCRQADEMIVESWQSSDAFHKVFLRAGEYFAEYDYRAYYCYDASGLGRLHRKGAPGSLCLSTPGTGTPAYRINGEDTVPFAIVPAIKYNGHWLSGADPEVIHQVSGHGTNEESSFMEINCIWPGKAEAESRYFLNKEGLQIIVESSGETGLIIPAFFFDGEVNTIISATSRRLSIKYRNRECIWQIDQGTLCNTGETGYNRNGHYKLFRVEAAGLLTVKVTIV